MYPYPGLTSTYATILPLEIVTVAIAWLVAPPPENTIVGGFCGSNPLPPLVIVILCTVATKLELTILPDGIQTAGATVNLVVLSILWIIVPLGTYAPGLVDDTTMPTDKLEVDDTVS